MPHSSPPPSHAPSAGSWWQRLFQSKAAPPHSGGSPGSDGIQAPQKEGEGSLSAPLTPTPPTPPKPPPPASKATTLLGYREEGARHLYQRNAERIYHGRLPPHLYAIGVLDITLDRQGRVMELDWLRAPTHAPEVIAEIERTIAEAEPFPAPGALGDVVYTETWLWHESGRFQLDTLTEGQD